MPVSVASSLSLAEQEEALRRSGGACVRCGCTIFHYCRAGDAASPAFLLCPDCLRALLTAHPPNDVVARLRDSPIAKQTYFDRSQFLFASRGKLPDFVFPKGGRMSGTPCPIAFGGQPVLTLTPGELQDGPLVLTLALGKGDGEPVIVVRRNHLVADPGEWTFQRSGNRYAFRHIGGDARLLFAWRGPGEVALDELFTTVKGRRLAIGREGATLDGSPVRIPTVRGHLVGLSL